MQTAVIYCRYSSDSQTEQSIDGQLRVCTEYAKSRDILILDTYIDRAMTGTNDNRPDFQRMIKDSAKRTFNIVLVYKGLVPARQGLHPDRLLHRNLLHPQTHPLYRR